MSWAEGSYAVAETAFRANPGPYVAVGHSLGGSIALSLAAIAPDRVADVVLVSGHLFTLGDLIAGLATRDPALRLALLRARLTASMPIPRPVRAGLARSSRLRSAMLPPFMNPALLTGDSMLGDCLADHTGRGTRRIYRLSRLVRLDDVALRCPAPVTIVEGGRDPLLRPADIDRARQLLTVRDHVILHRLRALDSGGTTTRVGAGDPGDLPARHVGLTGHLRHMAVAGPAAAEPRPGGQRQGESA